MRISCGGRLRRPWFWTKRRLAAACGVLWILAAGAAPASGAVVLTFQFSQTGYAGGATITGSFTGADLNGNGALSSFDGEISAFSMSFSDNVFVPAFSHATSDLAGLVYVLGTRFLGDDQILGFEGIPSGPSLSFPPPPTPGVFTYSYVTGFGPTGMTTGFGLVQDNNLPNTPFDITSRYVVIAGVPEPPTLLVLASGLGIAGAFRRWRPVACRPWRAGPFQPLRRA